MACRFAPGFGLFFSCCFAVCFCDDALQFYGILGTLLAPAFRTILQDHHRRPELDAERTPERPAGAVLRLDMAHLRKSAQRLADVGRGGLAVAAPVGAEID